MREFMRNLSLLLMAMCSLAFVSCSSDDDGDGGGSGSGNVSGYVIADGKRVDFKYGYMYEYYEEDGGSVSVEFFTDDILYYFYNQDKVPDGKVYSMLHIELPSTAERNVPTGQITDYHIDYDIDMPMIFGEFDDDVFGPTYMYYSTYGSNSDYDSFSPITISKSGKKYKISASNAPVRASGGGSDSGIDEQSRKTSLKFSFEGELTNITDVANSRAANATIVVVKDKDFAKFLRDLRVKTKNK